MDKKTRKAKLKWITYSAIIIRKHRSRWTKTIINCGLINHKEKESKINERS
jgi:hypothetical protein